MKLTTLASHNRGSKMVMLRQYCSSMMKGISRFGDVTPFVPSVVADALQRKIQKMRLNTIKMDEEITDVKVKKDCTARFSL